MMRKLMNRLENKAMKTVVKCKVVLMSKSGESSVGQAVAILTAVVLGALLLAGLYALLKDLVLPNLSDRIRDMFNYKG